MYKDTLDDNLFINSLIYLRIFYIETHLYIFVKHSLPFFLIACLWWHLGGQFGFTSVYGVDNKLFIIFWGYVWVWTIGICSKKGQGFKNFILNWHYLRMTLLDLWLSPSVDVWSKNSILWNRNRVKFLRQNLINAKYPTGKKMRHDNFLSSALHLPSLFTRSRR